MIEGDRVREYDDEGNLLSDRQATMQDVLDGIIDILTRKVEVAVTLDLKTGVGKISFKRVEG